MIGKLIYHMVTHSFLNENRGGGGILFRLSLWMSIGVLAKGKSTSRKRKKTLHAKKVDSWASSMERPFTLNLRLSRTDDGGGGGAKTVAEPMKTKQTVTSLGY